MCETNYMDQIYNQCIAITGDYLNKLNGLVTNVDIMVTEYYTVFKTEINL